MCECKLRAAAPPTEQATSPAEAGEEASDVHMLRRDLERTIAAGMQAEVIEAGHLVDTRVAKQVLLHSLQEGCHIATCSIGIKIRCVCIRSRLLPMQVAQYPAMGCFELTCLEV